MLLFLSRILQGHRSGRIPPLPDFSCPCFFSPLGTNKKSDIVAFFITQIFIDIFRESHPQCQ